MLKDLSLEEYLEIVDSDAKAREFVRSAWKGGLVS